MSSVLTIRDVPDEIASAVEAAAVAAEARSREAYLRDFLKRSFGPKNSLVASTAARARAAVSDFEALGRVGVLQPTPTISRIARSLDHPDASVLEAELRGDRPLLFSDGDRLCDLLSLDSEWLESGRDDAPRFRTRALYHDCNLMLHDFLQRGIPYQELYFVLSDGDRSEAAIIGHTPHENPAIGWRYDLLVDDVPIHNHVGATGRGQRRDFADLMVSLYEVDVFPEPVACIGRVVACAQYMAMVSGYVHPATATNTYARDGAQPVARNADWHEDFCEFSSVQNYTRSFGEAHAALLSELKVDRITSTTLYQTQARKKIARMKRYATPRQARSDSGPETANER